MIVTDFQRHRLDLYYTAPLEVMARLILRRQELISPLLPGLGWVLVHGAAVERQSGCVLFLAEDAGGKTTVARTAPAGTVLSDDRPVIRRLGMGVVVSGSYWGTIARPGRCCRLRGIVLLEKSQTFSLKPASREQVLDFLWNEERFHFFIPREDRVALFNLYNQMISQSRLWHMEFPRDTVDWSAIDAAMEQ